MENSKKLLDSLSKEELITILANVGDTIQTEYAWRQEGLDDRYSNILYRVTNAAVALGNFDISSIEKKLNN